MITLRGLGGEGKRHLGHSRWGPEGPLRVHLIYPLKGVRQLSPSVTAAALTAVASPSTVVGHRCVRLCSTPRIQFKPCENGAVSSFHVKQALSPRGVKLCLELMFRLEVTGRQDRLTGPVGSLCGSWQLAVVGGRSTFFWS